jgi:condensin complex subunit 2
MQVLAEETTAVRKPFGNIDLGEDDEDDEEEEMTEMVKLKKKKRKQQARRRRRSSARFLRLGATPDDDDDDEEEAAPESEQLGELYKRAIRMNAENRINAGNSWNLRLIENIDKLIINEEPEDYGGNSKSTAEPTVNFTKASCTLDASVKIYSYRVDDVHLTSYKVLANLNRNDANTTSSKTKKNTNNDGIDGEPGADATVDEERTSERRSADTLESNVGEFVLILVCFRCRCTCTYSLKHPFLA